MVKSPFEAALASAFLNALLFIFILKGSISCLSFPSKNLLKSAAVFLVLRGGGGGVNVYRGGMGGGGNCIFIADTDNILMTSLLSKF